MEKLNVCTLYVINYKVVKTFYFLFFVTCGLMIRYSNYFFHTIMICVFFFLLYWFINYACWLL